MPVEQEVSEVEQEVRSNEHCTCLLNLKEEEEEADGDLLCQGGGKSKTCNDTNWNKHARR